MAFKPEAIRPTDLRETGARELLVVWQDGHESLFPFSYLRRKCACAACIDEWTGISRLRPEKVSEEVRPLATKPVGNYGIRFDWSDGHTTGIYAFDYLRSICPCPACRGVKL